MDKPVISDACHNPTHSFFLNTKRTFDCHLLSGWTKGQKSCPFWEKLCGFCQTDAERRFLYQYLSFTKNRDFPMLIPQGRIGIGQRRRPDFVLFVPLQYWFYKSYAIQLDAAHSQEMSTEDDLRDAYLSVHGYEVIRFRARQQGYFEDVRTLVEMVETQMARADSNWSNFAIQPKAGIECGTHKRLL